MKMGGGSSSPKTIALILGGGVGSRMQQDIPKQFLTVDDCPVIIYTMQAFQNHPEIDAIAAVCLEGWENVLQAYAKQFNITKLKYIVRGGENRQSSSRIGLYELEKYYDAEDIVLIHDGNRPLTSAKIISDCIATVKEYGCACAAIPCADVMMKTDDDFITLAEYPRDKLKVGQTPRGFYLGKVCDVHRRALKAGITNSIGSHTLMMELGEPVYLYKGSEKNFKITTVEDIEIFKALLNSEKPKYLK